MFVLAVANPSESTFSGVPFRFGSWPTHKY